MKSLYTKFDFTIDKGKERLNPSREKIKGKHRRRKVDKESCVTPAGTSTSLTSRINGKTKHPHTLIMSESTGENPPGKQERATSPLVIL